jgi:hypothetical protein
VVVSNALGSVISSNAMLTVLFGDTLGSHVAIFGAPSTESWQQDVVNKLLETGFFLQVDSFVNGRDPVPTLEQLSDYGAVLVYSDAGFNEPQILGDVLADYVDQGGGVVVATFALGSGSLAGRFEFEGYSPFVSGGSSSGTPQSLVPDLPLHRSWPALAPWTTAPAPSETPRLSWLQARRSSRIGITTTPGRDTGDSGRACGQSESLPALERRAAGLLECAN